MSASMSNLVEWLLGTDSFPARWHCGSWSALLGWTHVVADLVTALSYFAIPFALLVIHRHVAGANDAETLLMMRGLWRLSGMLVPLAVAFIGLCGVNHAIEALIFWVPIYRIQAVHKLALSGVSLVTAVSLAQVAARFTAIRRESAPPKVPIVKGGK